VSGANLGSPLDTGRLASKIEGLVPGPWLAGYIAKEIINRQFLQWGPEGQRLAF